MPINHEYANTELHQTDHISIQVISAALANLSASDGTPQLPIARSSHSHAYTANHPVEEVSNPQQLTSPEGSQSKRLWPRCYPLSLSTFFVCLGRFLTGYNLTIKLPKCLSDKLVTSTLTDRSIPFDNLEEDIRPQQQPNNGTCASVNDNQSNTTTSSVLQVQFKLPYFMIIISLTQWVFFHFVMHGEYEGWMSSHLQFNPLKRYEVWRFLTALWIHGTVTHLRGNLRFQLISGCCLEVVHGWKRVACLYIGGVLFANLTTSVLEPFLMAYGASGGAYALLTGHLASIIMNWHEIWEASNRCLLIVIYLGLSVFAAFNKTVSQHGLPAHHLVGHAAHVGGALGGLLIGFFVLKNFHKKSWEIKTAKICRNITLILFILAVGANIGDQIFYFKSVEYERQKKLLLLLQNHTNASSNFPHSNINAISNVNTKSASVAFILDY